MPCNPFLYNHLLLLPQTLVTLLKQAVISNKKENSIKKCYSPLSLYLRDYSCRVTPLVVTTKWRHSPEVRPAAVHLPESFRTSLAAGVLLLRRPFRDSPASHHPPCILLFPQIFYHYWQHNCKAFSAAVLAS